MQYACLWRLKPGLGHLAQQEIPEHRDSLGMAQFFRIREVDVVVASVEVGQQHLELGRFTRQIVGQGSYPQAGLEAMLQLDDHDKSFDAVVTDLQMPRLGGRAMYEQLVTGRPLVAKRFVFVTGDQARGETRTFLENCGQPSVTKPYDLSDLINAIGTVARKK